MGMMFKIMAIVFFINISAGLIQAVGIDSALHFDNTKSDNLRAEFDTSISGAPVEGSTNFGEKILNFVTVGLWDKIKGFINDYLFGVPNLLKEAGIINTAIAAIVSMAMTIIYILGMIELFTGRRVNE